MNKALAILAVVVVLMLGGMFWLKYKTQIAPLFVSQKTATSTVTVTDTPTGSTASTRASNPILMTPPPVYIAFKGGTPPDLVKVYFKTYSWLSGTVGYYDLYRSTTGDKGKYSKIKEHLPGNTVSVDDSGYNADYTSVFYYVVAVDANGNESSPSAPSRIVK